MNNSIDLIIVKPGDQKQVFGQLSSSLSAIEPPLWAALFAAHVKSKGFSVEIIDAEADNLTPQLTADKALNKNPYLILFVIVGNNLSASTWNMNAARAYINRINEGKTSNVKTMIWGLHPSALPERTLKEEKIDYVCDGEGFYTLIDLLTFLKKNNAEADIKTQGLWFFDNDRMVSTGKAKIIMNLDELPTPAWELLPMDKYRAHNWHCFYDENKRQPYGILYASLGCPFNCTFCSLKTLFEGKPGIRYRSANKVIEDIDALVKGYGIKNIKMLDECFILNENYVIEICDLIIDRGFDLNIWAYARIDTLKKSMLKKLKHAGFNWLAFGIESGAKKVLSGVSKGRYGEEEIRNAIRITKEEGISIVGNFMFGLPDDDLETMQQTLALAKDLNCEYTNFYVTMAYPGSQLFDLAIKDNIKLPDTWLGYSQYSEDCLPLPTKYLAAAAVLDFRDKAFIEFYSNPKYLEMIERKFGKVASNNIKNMLKFRIKRKLLDTVKRGE